MATTTTTVRLPVSVLESARELAKSRGIAVSAMIREIVEALAARGAPLPVTDAVAVATYRLLRSVTTNYTPTFTFRINRASLASAHEAAAAGDVTLTTAVLEAVVAAVQSAESHD